MKPYYNHAGITIYHGHTLEVLKSMEAKFVQCCVTSPPYWGLRDYGLPPMIWDGDKNCKHEWENEISLQKSNNNATGKSTLNSKPCKDVEMKDIYQSSQGQFCQLCGAWRGSLGLEPTPELYVNHLVQIFNEVKRVLRKDGTLWLVIGDSYAGSGSPGGDFRDGKGGDEYLRPYNRKGDGLKPKDLCMIPARVALALQKDGWWLRSMLPWVKRSAMPESCDDRPSSALEYVLLLSKSQKYYFDMDAIRKEYIEPLNRYGGDKKKLSENLKNGSYHASAHRERNMRPNPSGRNFRNTDLFYESTTLPHGMMFCGNEIIGIDVNPKGFKTAHFATFPEKLIEPLILAGSSEKGCCPKCGSSWKRIIDYKANYEKREISHTPNNSLTKVDSSGWKPPTIKQIGWEPTCKCGIKKTIPCTVLDPFLGSGTSVLVAHKLRRHSVGIELSEFYLKNIVIPRIEKETKQLKMF